MRKGDCHFTKKLDFLRNVRTSDTPKQIDICFQHDFKCAKCNQNKTVSGRKRYKKIDTDSKNRPQYNFQCSDCFKL